MTGALLFLHAISPLHVGCRGPAADVHQPVRRERLTGWPLIDGSGVKGALLADAFGADHDTWRSHAFGSGGKEAAVAELAFGDARIVALPVRAGDGGWRWLACHESLARFERDCRRAGLSVASLVDPAWGSMADEHVHLPPSDAPQAATSTVVLEEFAFAVQESEPAKRIAAAVAELAFADDWTKTRFASHFAVVSNRAFGHFARFATHAVTRNAIDYVTKNVRENHLFRQEFVLPDTLFASVVTTGRSPTSRRGDGSTIEHFRRFIQPPHTAPRAAGHLLRPLAVGGDETVGYGFCAVRLAWEPEMPAEGMRA